MNTKVTVDTKAFEASVNKFQKSLAEAIAKAMVVSIKDLKRESEALAPFKTGDLENSVSTSVNKTSTGVEGIVEFTVEYAALRHNDLGAAPGPGTEAKASTKYGQPGPNFLFNPAIGLGKDKTYHKNIQAEYKAIK